MEVKEIYENMTYGPAPESMKMADEWFAKYNKKFQLFVNGEWLEPTSGEYFETINPANKKVMAEVAQANKDDVNTAMEAAERAFPKWRDLGGHGRARYLYAIARQMQKHSRLFAVLETMDNGKPIRESRDVDIPLVARWFYHNAGWAQTMDDELPGYEPLGVIGAIVPWNFPLLISSWKIAPALAMGNTMVIKPAKLTSLTALLFAEICKSVGLPPGVFNVTTGSGSKTGTYITNHPLLKKLTFTGSTLVGQILRRAIAGTGKKITLELGGKSPYIVFDDADFDSAVEGVIEAIWFNQGQVCCAGSRLLVQENIADKFIKRLKDRMKTLRVGDPMDKTTDIGAIVDKTQLDTIESFVKIGDDEGGTKFQPEFTCPDDGYYHLPTLFTDVSSTSTIVIEEIFGPVLVSMTFRTPEEAVALANNTRYGLAASIWTENINLALDIAPKIKAGTVWINDANVFDAASGFGGYKESGFGREGGIEGLWDFVKPNWEKEYKKKAFTRKTQELTKTVIEELPGIDRTAKMYVGGKQARPDGNYSLTIKSPIDTIVGEVGRGNRKDIRNAVEAASKSKKWSSMPGHGRAQVIYYIAENLIARKEEFASRIVQMTGVSDEEAGNEVDESIHRLYYYAAMADKHDGRVHNTPRRSVVLAMNEPVGVIGIVCPEEYPLLGFISTVIAAISMGNNVVVIPSEKYPLSATDFYQVLDTSDLPGGTINIVTGLKEEMLETLAGHDGLDALWYFGPKSQCKMIETVASENMKRTWLSFGLHRDWMNRQHGMGKEFLRKSSEVKNIWVPYGEFIR